MLIAGIDIGTTGAKVTVYSDRGEFAGNAYREYSSVTRNQNTQEIDAGEIRESVFAVLREAAQKIPGIAAVGVTSFGESFAMLDADDNILFPAMLYTDPRGSEETAELVAKLGEDHITSIIGVKPHSMFSLPKVMWIKKHYPELYKRAKRILLMEDFIVYSLTGVAAIDDSLASRTMAYDIRKLAWSKEIFDAAGVDIGLMSKPVRPGSVAGKILPAVADKLGLSRDAVVVNAAQDQVSSAVGAGALEVGSVVDGTGTVECVTPVFDHIPENEQLYREGYSVSPYIFPHTYVCYAVSFTGGAAVKWYRDTFAKYEAEIAKREGKNVYAILDGSIPEGPTDLLVMPHFAGAANPYMDTSSRASILGLTLGHTAADVYKAIMEGVTYEMLLNIEHLESFGIRVSSLYATGGGAASDVWLRIKADILGRKMIPLSQKEVGACGTCMLTAVALGIYPDVFAAKQYFVKPRTEILPDPDRNKLYAKRFEAYKKIYGAVSEIQKTLAGQ